MSGPFGPLSETASGAIAMLGYQPVRAEDYPASPSSTQVACLAAVALASPAACLVSQTIRTAEVAGAASPARNAPDTDEASLGVLAPATHAALLISPYQDSLCSTGALNPVLVARGLDDGWTAEDFCPTERTARGPVTPLPRGQRR